MYALDVGRFCDVAVASPSLRRMIASWIPASPPGRASVVNDDAASVITFA